MSEPARSIDGDVRVWWGTTPADAPFIRALLKAYREYEFFWVPENIVERELAHRNIICFDYRKLQAGYLWITCGASGRARINQIAVDEQLWRNTVGSHVVAFFENYVRSVHGWSIYLSCNSNTPGHNFWPQLGYAPIIQTPGGRRRGTNIIWAKLISDAGFLFPPSIKDVKAAHTYKPQSSITLHNAAARRLRGEVPMDLFTSSET